MEWPRNAHLVDVFEHDDADLHCDAEEGEETDTGGDREVRSCEPEGEQATKRGQGDVGRRMASPLARMEHRVKENEDKDDGNRQNQHEPAGGAFRLVLSGPVDPVSGRQFHLSVHLFDGLFDCGAEVAVANAVFDWQRNAGQPRDRSPPVLALTVVSWVRETRSPDGARRRILSIAS